MSYSVVLDRARRWGHARADHGTDPRTGGYEVRIDPEASRGRCPNAKLGILLRSDGGGRQVTYNGHPLYRYTGDQSAGDATGDGIGGQWHMVTIQ